MLVAYGLREDRVPGITVSLIPVSGQTSILSRWVFSQAKQGVTGTSTRDNEAAALKSSVMGLMP